MARHTCTAAVGAHQCRACCRARGQSPLTTKEGKRGWHGCPRPPWGSRPVSAGPPRGSCRGHFRLGWDTGDTGSVPFQFLLCWGFLAASQTAQKSDGQEPSWSRTGSSWAALLCTPHAVLIQ